MVGISASPTTGEIEPQAAKAGIWQPSTKREVACSALQTYFTDFGYSGRCPIIPRSSQLLYMESQHFKAGRDPKSLRIQFLADAGSPKLNSPDRLLSKPPRKERIHHHSLVFLMLDVFLILNWNRPSQSLNPLLRPLQLQKANLLHLLHIFEDIDHITLKSCLLLHAKHPYLPHSIIPYSAWSPDLLIILVTFSGHFLDSLKPVNWTQYFRLDQSKKERIYDFPWFWMISIFWYSPEFHLLFIYLATTSCCWLSLWSTKTPWSSSDEQ